MGRMLIYTGLAFIVAGVLVSLFSRSSLPLGRLPGDIVWRGKSGTVYFPIVTCLLLSLIASVLLWLFSRR